MVKSECISGPKKIGFLTNNFKTFTPKLEWKKKTWHPKKSRYMALTYRNPALKVYNSKKPHEIYTINIILI